MKCIYSLLLTTSGATTVLQSIIFLLWIVAIASQLVWMSLSSTAWCQYIAHWDAVILAVSYHLLFKSIWWLFTSLRVKAKVFMPFWTWTLPLTIPIVSFLLNTGNMLAIGQLFFPFVVAAISYPSRCEGFPVSEDWPYIYTPNRETVWNFYSNTYLRR